MIIKPLSNEPSSLFTGQRSPLKVMFGKNDPSYTRMVQVELGGKSGKSQQSGKANADLNIEPALLQKLVQEVMNDFLVKFKKALGKAPAETLQAVLNTKTLNVKLPLDKLARDLSEQATLQGYNTNAFRKNNAPPQKLSKVTLANLPSTPAIKSAIKEGTAIGEAMNLARRLVDAPPNLKNPEWISEQAQALQSKYKTLKVDIHDKSWIEDQKMGLFLSVAAGNQTTVKDAPRLAEMVYTPANGKYDKTILLVGKGITFDTGGNNLKPSEFIHNMHGDMAGAAAVIGTMKTIAEMKLPNVRVVGLTPLTPNRIGENATLPQSIFTSRSGKTAEIGNTDAEGRLVLADALHYGGEKYKPDFIVDIATLTGGKVRALGAQNAIGAMSNKSALAKQVANLESELGRKTGAYEITEAHRQWITRFTKADVTNSISMKYGEQVGLFGKDMNGQNRPFSQERDVAHHMIQGGAFLKEFLYNPKTPWVHLDMAGAEFEQVENGPEQATGFGVKDLYAIVKSVSDGSLQTAEKKATQKTK